MDERSWVHRLPSWFYVALGLIAFLALVGRGGLFHYVGSIYLAGLGVVVALLVAVHGAFRQRPWKRRSLVIAGVSVAQLVSMPVGYALNAWDVRRGKAWCERNAPALIGLSERRAEEVRRTFRGRPMLADFIGDSCVVSDRTSLMRWWSYDPSSRTWYEED